MHKMGISVKRLNKFDICIYIYSDQKLKEHKATYIHTYFPKLLTATLTITKVGTGTYIVCCCRKFLYVIRYTIANTYRYRY